MKKIKIKMLSAEARLPERAHKGDAGFDVFIPRNVIVKPGRNMIPLDFALEMPEWHQAQIEPRSGCSSKGIEGYEVIGEGLCYGKMKHFDIDVLHGKIDAPYRGNIGVIIKNYEPFPVMLEAGSKIAQMTFYELPHVRGFEVVDRLSETDRGEHGFGSSGRK